MVDILKETYGVMVYQEQIIQSVQILADFSLGQADLLRRAIGKKTPEIREGGRRFREMLRGREGNFPNHF